MKKMRYIIALILFGGSTMGVASTDDMPAKDSSSKLSSPNPCPTNDSVCAEQKAKELDKAAKAHEAKMEELKARALGKV